MATTHELLNKVRRVTTLFRPLHDLEDVLQEAAGLENLLQELKAAEAAARTSFETQKAEYDRQLQAAHEATRQAQRELTEAQGERQAQLEGLDQEIAGKEETLVDLAVSIRQREALLEKLKGDIRAVTEKF